MDRFKSSKTSAAWISALIVMISADVTALEWGTDQDKVKSAVLGTFWGNPITYELRTQVAGLESSHVRVKIDWFNKAEKRAESQIIIEDERAARFEEYELKYDKPNLTIFITYPCPLTRKDKETSCTERWMYHQAKNLFVLKEKTSSNPVAKSREKITELLKAGKIDKAMSSIKLMEKAQKDDEQLSTDEWFVAYFDYAHSQIKAAYKAKQLDNAYELLEALHKKAPLQSSLSCPDAEQLLFCLDGKTECGCSERFGMLPAEERYAQKLEDLARVWDKKKEYKKVIAILTPVAARFPDQTDVRLLLADALWETDFKEKARPHYKAVRSIRLTDKTFIPPHVFERFKEQ